MTPVANVIELAKLRLTRLEQAAQAAARHPALRWTASGCHQYAHRRNPQGRASCNAPGHLTLAPPTIPLCPNCYRP